MLPILSWASLSQKAPLLLMSVSRSVSSTEKADLPRTALSIPVSYSEWGMQSHLGGCVCELISFPINKRLLLHFLFCNRILLGRIGKYYDSQTSTVTYFFTPGPN